MKLGDAVTVFPYMGINNGQAMTGTVVYINPAHHYYTVQFPLGWRQSFKEGTVR